MIRPALYLFAAFLAGSLPFGLWIGRLARGVDVRTQGSGNIGATNVLRVAGLGWGVLALLLDIAKGWAGVMLLPAALGLEGVRSGGGWPVVGALCATGGHIFSPWVGFRGGKGVATFIGAAFALAPGPAAVAVAGFLATVGVWRYVSVGSIVMAGLFPLAALILGPPALRTAIAAVGAGLAVLITWRHRANWVRLARGEEPRLGRAR
jgi:glycerol-3-phosphate acyltransferase PlsY